MRDEPSRPSPEFSLAADAAEESRRLSALYSLKLLDTPPSETFDRLTRVAAAALRAPMSFFALVDLDRQWIKAAFGSDLKETPREWAFCNFTIRDDTTFVVEDAWSDPRFAANPYVTGPGGIRSYAGVPVRSAEGARIGSLCVVDVTPRRFTEAEHALLAEFGRMVEQAIEQHVRASSQARDYHRLQSILDASPDAIIAVDERLRIERFSRGAERLFGWREAEMIGQTVGRLLPGGAGARHDDLMAAFRDGPVDTGGMGDWRHVRAQRRDGGETPILASIGRTRLADGGAVMVMVARDMTAEIAQERAAQEAIETASLAVRLQAEVDSRAQLLASIGHDLRQPVQALAFFAEAARDSRGAQRRALVDRIAQSTESLLSQLNAVLDLGRIDADMVRAMPRPVDVAPMLRRLAAEAQGLAAMRPLRVRAHLREAWSLVDASMLERLMRLLLDNAVKFTLRGGILIGVRLRANHVLIDLIDTGPGIALQHQALIFEAWRHRDVLPERERDGSGIGLATVRRLADAMCVAVQLSSVVGSGTRFTLAVPRGAPPTESVAAPPAIVRRSVARPGRILVVDDDVDIRAGLSLALIRRGFRVAAFADVETATTVDWQADPIYGAIVDLRFRRTRAQGEDLISFLRHGMIGTTPLKIVVLTGELVDPAAQAIGGCLVDRIFLKPIGRAQVDEIATFLGSD